MIKYKLWDKENKKFLEDDWETDYAILPNGIVIEMYDNGFGEGYSVHNLDNIEVLQFTGFKDKSGKEIYEGDILRYRFPYDGRIIHISSVSYLEIQSSFGIVDLYGNNIPLYDIACKEYVEVIGNIYENKELLKGNDKNIDYK